jgi:ParB-like chromosome segregation protein Spo0J
MTKQARKADDTKRWPASEIVTRATADLIPYARNSRTHSPAQVGQIAASIREFGWTIPVLIDPDNGIIAGHGRIMAAQQLGIDKVPCIVAHGWSEAQRRAYVIADNKLPENAGWDMDMLKVEVAGLAELNFDTSLLGFSSSELSKLLDPDDLVNFGVDGDESRGSSRNFLRFGDVKVSMTDEEVVALTALKDKYVEEMGADYGFASYLIEGRKNA